MTGRSDRGERDVRDDMIDREVYGDTDSPLVSPQRESIQRSGTSDVGGARSLDRGDAGPQPEAPLFSSAEAEQLRTRWESVQAGFVDEPRRAVEEADGLVRTVMERLSDGFTDQRERLEQEWGARDQVSTEDLRVALRHYRSFFDRLLRI
jgi:hypothetical protein